MVFSIQTQDGSLDIFKQDIAWEWKNFRFTDGLRDQFSTDIEIPKTNNNCDILGISGLLDSQSQMFGERIQPCILEIDGSTMDVYMQVVSINEDTITICLYERTLPVEEREKNIARIKVDDDSTIIAWNVNTTTAYPDWFKKYDYGMAYNSNYAQYHPVIKLNDVIDVIASDTNLSIENVDNDYYTMATGKWLCPQNTRQTLEGLQTDEGFRIMGGQHVTNDLSFTYTTSDTDRITFNRSCHVEINLWVSWLWRHNGYKIPFLVNHHKESDSSNNTQSLQLDALNYVNDVNTATFSFDVESGDHISFGIPNGDMFDMVRCLADMRITHYEITEDDYGHDMEYVGRVPRLVVYQWGSDSFQYWYFDASTYDLGYHRRNTSNTLHRYMDTTWTSFAWFGFWANVPELKVGEFLYGMCWLLGKRVKFSNGEVLFEYPWESTVLENASITEISPNSDYLGRRNVVKWNDDEFPVLVSEIDNKWIEPERTLHSSPFGKIERVGTFVGKTDQYSNPEYDPETQEYKCDFNEVGFLVWCNDSHYGGMQIENKWMRGVSIKTMGLEEITQTMTVTIDSMDFDCNVDYVYLDGRKFMVVEGDTDLNTKETTLTALLVPGKEDEDKSKPTTQAIWQLESETVTNISCVTDQYGNTGMADVTRTATYVDINELSPTYNQTRTVDETVRVEDQTNCPVNTDPIWQNEQETMTDYECLTDDYGNTGQCVKTYTTTYRDVNPRSATHGQTRTVTRSETVTDTTLCPINGPRTEYFTIKNLSNSTNTITLTSLNDSGYATTSVDVSTDGGTTWNSYRSSQNGTTIATLAKGKSLIMRHTGAMAPNGNENCIDGSGDYEVSGNIASIIRGNNFNTGSTLTMPSHAFYRLFKNSTHLKSANKLYFGAYSVVSSSSMLEMFYGCTNLVSPPNFGSITGVNGTGMYQMFMGCTSLSTCPYLSNITRVEERGMYQMFGSCTSITASPDLSSISIIGNRSMYGMFGGCTSLITPPDLSGITNVYEYSMYEMFAQCRSLTSGPDLSNVENVQTHGMDSMFGYCTSLVTPPLFENITNVDERGMYDMFKNCTSLVSGPYLSSITSLGSEGMKYLFNGCSVLTTAYAPNITWDTSKTENWMQGVPETHDGMLYAKSSMIDTITWGASGIPSQWRKTAI